MKPKKDLACTDDDNVFMELKDIINSVLRIYAPNRIKGRSQRKRPRLNRLKKNKF